MRAGRVTSAACSGVIQRTIAPWALHEFLIDAEVLFGSQQLIQQQGHVHRGDPVLGDCGQPADYVRGRAPC
jgi:hypothetical protein